MCERILNEALIMSGEEKKKEEYYDKGKEVRGEKEGGEEKKKDYYKGKEVRGEK